MNTFILETIGAGTTKFDIHVSYYTIKTKLILEFDCKLILSIKTKLQE